MNTIERRRHARAQVLTTVVLSWNDRRCRGAFNVINLSAGGVLLDGHAPVDVGIEVDVLLHLPGAAPVRTPAHVIRSDQSSGRRSFALSFSGLSPAAEQSIDEVVQAELIHALTAPVMIVDDSADASRTLKRQLARVGSSSFVVRTSLEAIQSLERPNRVAVAIVHSGLSDCRGTELLLLLAEQHPKIRRVLVGNVAIERPAAAAHARTDADSPGYEILTPPWTAASIAALVRA